MNFANNDKLYPYISNLYTSWLIVVLIFMVKC